MLTSLTLALALAAGAAASDAAIPLPAKAEAALRGQATRLLDAWIRGADEEFVKLVYPRLALPLALDEDPRFEPGAAAGAEAPARVTP